VEIVSGRSDWEKAHIPGSTFADLLADLTDRNRPELMFPMPPAEQFAEAMSSYGVGEGTRVILYDRMLSIWAARVWWMLRTFGFDNAAILNGGWAKWTHEGRPVSSDPPSYPRGNFVVRHRPELIVMKEDVIQAIEDDSTCLINALDPDEYAGCGPVRYGRSGHIPSSTNVSFLGLVEPGANAYVSAERLREQFSAAGALEKKRVITYCGGGIAASNAAFALTLLGKDNVAVYDGSMTEWAADPTLPLETGS